MFLCFDIGNSHLCGGVFDQDKLLIQFRYHSKPGITSDEIGVFVRSVLRENQINYQLITKIGIASVVPSLDYTLRASCVKYLGIKPLFLTSQVPTKIKINTENPQEVGADLIAGAMASQFLYPHHDLLIFDLGTATTCCLLTKSGTMEGVAIAPGIRIMMEALLNNTAKLFRVSLVRPHQSMGKNTKAAIQSGVYYAQLGLIKQLIEHVQTEYGLPHQPTIIGTGGFSNMFSTSQVFDHIVPELVLLDVKLMLDDQATTANI